MKKLVKDIMTPVPKVISVREDTPVTDVANILFEHNFNGLPVVGENNELKGIISERDLIIGGQNVYLPTFLDLVEQVQFHGKKGDMPEELKKLTHITAGQVMKKPPLFTVHPNMPVEELAKILAEEHVNPVPVVELGKLVGIASRSDVVKLLAPSHLHIKPREQQQGAQPSELDPLFKKAVVKLERGYIVVERIRFRLWWVFLIVAFIVGFIASIVWIIRINL
jgi:CBS domain-containing protein